MAEVQVDPLVMHDDLGTFLVRRYTALLKARPEPLMQRATVRDREPAPGQPFPNPLVVLRVDPGQDTSILTAERDVGVSILAGTKANPTEAWELARMVHALRLALPGVQPNPIAAVLSSGQPSEVPENQPYARLYFPLTLAVVGRPL